MCPEKCLAVCFWALFCPALFSQQPFTCRGSFYLAIAPQSSSSLYEVQISQATGNVTFNGLSAG
ncbi:MAG: hypothetical protein J5I98_33620, partial [Phaeodactylibacter sp.]|nr:hypothetical protein [Phaeodactylibacter sp.]